MFQWQLTRYLGWILFKTLYGFKVEGAENLPSTGALIVASNHQSYADPVILAVVSRRPIRFMAKAELFKIPVLGNLVRWYKAFPVKRDQADLQAIKSALAFLAEGRVVGIFPEGTRYKDGDLGPGLRGAGLIALKSGVPVVPVAIVGSEKIMADHNWRPGFPRIRAVVGEPFTIDRKRKERDEVSRATSEIMRRIAMLKE